MSNVFNYIFLILYLIALIFGVSTFLSAALYYFIERIMWFKYYLVFLGLFGVLVFIKIVNLYSSVSDTGENLYYINTFNIIQLFFLNIAIAFMVYVVPVFIYHFLSIGWRKRYNAVFLSLSVLCFLLGLLGLLVSIDIYYFSISIFYLVVIFLFVITLKNYKNVKDKTLKIVFKLLGVLTCLTVPIFILQFIYIKSIYMSNMNIIDITLLIFYIWWNAVMTGYFFWYFYNIVTKINVNMNMKTDKTIISNTKNDIVENLTKREKEIVSYLLKGKSNKEISILLNISLNTVNNHVANIYEKTNVKNRVELVNKIIKN